MLGRPRRLFGCWLFGLWVALGSGPLMTAACALTLEQALVLAKETVPRLQAVRKQVLSTKERKQAALSPYFPSLDLRAGAEHSDIFRDRYDQLSYDTSLSYTLFDGGKRRADYTIAGLDLDSRRAEYRKALLDLELAVKQAFYNALATEEILRHRKLQLKDAKKVLDVAQGRFAAGVVKRSDVLQASVRFQQSRFSMNRAAGNVRKYRARLNSLIGRSLNAPTRLEGVLHPPTPEVPLEQLYAIAFKRPLIRQAQDRIGISKSRKKLEVSRFWPTISARASYSQDEFHGTRSFDGGDQKKVGLEAEWNLFDLGKFYRTHAWDYDIGAAREELSEVKRGIKVAVHNAYEDYLTARKNVPVARQQLKEAQHNYRQALKEYQIGKGDILSLVESEKALALAREQLTLSRLSLILAWSQLERTVGVHSLAALVKTEGRMR